MAITIQEAVQSRALVTGENESLTLRYIITGTASEQEARSTLELKSPSMYQGLLRDSCTVDPVWADDDADDGQWLGSARYVMPDATEPETGDFTTSFDTTGGTQHITQAISPQSVGTAATHPENAPNMFNTIGNTGDAVQGTDIVVPVYRWSETHCLPDSMVTPQYRRMLYLATGEVNQEAWREFGVNDSLFMGASGSKRARGDWSVTFMFAAAPTRTEEIGPFKVTKRGWQYVWCRYHRKVEGTGENKTLMMKPVAVYVNNVYYVFDFSKFGI